VLHCDIRPKNVFMQKRLGRAAAAGRGSWQAILADFDVSLDSGARATLLHTTRTEGPRGFEGVLTMAPELRTPPFEGCSFASDMYSFGGLLFVALYPDVPTDAVEKSPEDDVVVREHPVNVDVAPLVRKLLKRVPRERPSASEALAFALFAAAGANDLAQVLAVQMPQP
jgi:serine/threonine protein kinase